MPYYQPTDMSAMLSNAMPQSEATAGASGAAGQASRGDHKHQRLTSATTTTLDANGLATVTFTRSFASQPRIAFAYAESADAEPIILKRVSWVIDGGGNYTGVNIKGYRLRTLPASIALLTVLISFSISAGSAAGISVDVIALEQS